MSTRTVRKKISIPAEEWFSYSVIGIWLCRCHRRKWNLSAGESWSSSSWSSRHRKKTIIAMTPEGVFSPPSPNAIFFDWKNKQTYIVYMHGTANPTISLDRLDRLQRAGAKCVSDWGRNCLTSFPKQALFMMMTGVNKGIKERCSKPGTAVSFMMQIFLNISNVHSRWSESPFSVDRMICKSSSHHIITLIMIHYRFIWRARSAWGNQRMDNTHVWNPWEATWTGWSSCPGGRIGSPPSVGLYSMTHIIHDEGLRFRSNYYSVEESLWTCHHLDSLLSFSHTNYSVDDCFQIPVSPLNILWHT